VRRSLALIAVAAAVAIAAAIVIAGMDSGGAADADAASGQTASALPSGHPSVAATDDETTDPHATSDEAADEPAVDDDTLSALEAKRDEHPGDVQALVDLGDAYFMRQHLQKAEQAYTQALALDPESAAAQVGLAMVWHADGDSKRAEKALTAVLEAHPDNQDAHYSLAIVYFSGGRVDEAKREWQTAARIDPGTTTGRRSQSFVDLLEDSESAAPSAN
jgi:cytochrome c-type biogenesis protein CcmH/NrfG